VIVGGYVLHVYCDYPKCKSGEFGMRSAMDEFGGPTAIAARKEARHKGWSFTKDGRCYCRAHSLLKDRP
jgi:hypothetical protein